MKNTFLTLQVLCTLIHRRRSLYSFLLPHFPPQLFSHCNFRFEYDISKHFALSFAMFISTDESSWLEPIEAEWPVYTPVFSISLVQIMACCPCDTNPIPEPMLPHYLNQCWIISIENLKANSSDIWIKTHKVLFTKMYFKMSTKWQPCSIC